LPGKLVRDRIPEIIHQAGKRCTVRQLDSKEYRAALKAKLIEEAQEVVAAGADLVTELADLCEVMDALMVEHGIAQADVQAVQGQRRRDRGGFAQRIWLDQVAE